MTQLARFQKRSRPRLRCRNACATKCRDVTADSTVHVTIPKPRRVSWPGHDWSTFSALHSTMAMIDSRPALSSQFIRPRFSFRSRKVCRKNGRRLQHRTLRLLLRHQLVLPGDALRMDVCPRIMQLGQVSIRLLSLLPLFLRNLPHMDSPQHPKPQRSSFDSVSD